MRKAFGLFIVAVILVFAQSIFAQSVTNGELLAVGKGGKELGNCPLKNTSVKADISGFLARVKVTQEFENNFSEPIEAVYVFPLSNKAAVDDMTMTVGTRNIRGKIMKREEARKVYETARDGGQTASLLDQERPNIFTQSVANILPNEKILIEISYVETLKYEDGSYEFVFPMVVAPRYNPAQVEDSKAITPPVATTRAGHDISIEVNLDAGVPIENIASKSHEIENAMFSASNSSIKLKDEKTIPNKDFILRYDVAGKKINDAILTHRDANGGFFTLILQPPDTFRVEDVAPKEIVFVLDTSGSMSGFPIEKAKESMKLALDGLNPFDTFNLITFAGDTHILFEKPLPATAENLRKAQEFLASRYGSGGTEMMTAIRAALAPSASQDHIRVVCFMTDGYVGNEAEIIAEIQKYKNARVFSFGIGSSVNRFLLDKMAEEGRGEVEYVALNDDGSAAAKRFYERVRSPLLTDISIDWNGLPVADIYPQRLNDLFSAKPLIIHGRYTKAGSGTIKLKGKIGGQEIVREIAVNLPETEANHDVLATLWARTKIDELTKQDYQNQKPEVQAEITNIGLEYRLLTAFTSFVAVEEKVVTDGGKPRKIEVPVEMPEGMNRETTLGDNVLRRELSGVKGRNVKVETKKVYGSWNKGDVGYLISSPLPQPKSTPVPKNNPSLPNPTSLTSIDGPISGGVVNGKARNLVKPNYPPAGKAVRASGAVSVQVLIDERGRVISATAVGGHPLLRAAAEQAARASTFSPTMLSGQAVKISGTVVYNFVPEQQSATASVAQLGEPTTGAQTTEPPKPLTPAEKRTALLESKLNPAILDLVKRLEAKQELTADDKKFIKDGRAEIIVRVAEMKPETLDELKKLGFEIVAEMLSAKAFVGRIAPENLAKLAEIENIVFVAPNLN